MGNKPHKVQRGAAGREALGQDRSPPHLCEWCLQELLRRPPPQDRGGRGGRPRHGGGGHNMTDTPLRPAPFSGQTTRAPDRHGWDRGSGRRCCPPPGRRGPGHTQLRALWEGSNRSRVFLGPGGDEVRSIFPGKRKQQPVFANGEGQWRWWGSLTVPAGKLGGRQVPAMSMMPDSCQRPPDSCQRPPHPRQRPAGGRSTATRSRSVLGWRPVENEPGSLACPTLEGCTGGSESAGFRTRVIFLVVE